MLLVCDAAACCHSSRVCYRRRHGAVASTSRPSCKRASRALPLRCRLRRRVPLCSSVAAPRTWDCPSMASHASGSSTMGPRRVASPSRLPGGKIHVISYLILGGMTCVRCVHPLRQELSARVTAVARFKLEPPRYVSPPPVTAAVESAERLPENQPADANGGRGRPSLARP